MSLDAMYTGLYRLFYKRGARDAFFQAGHVPVAGLTALERDQLARADGFRMDVVVQLHSRDIGHQWYMPRVPATWTALPIALDCDESELVFRFAESDEFDTRVDDDADGRALQAWVDSLAQEGKLGAAWLPDLLRYERLLGAKWEQDITPRVDFFRWDVPGIRDAMLHQRLFPTDESPRKYAALFHRNCSGVTEAPLNHGITKALRAFFAEADTSEFSPNALARCRKVLAAMDERNKQ